MNSSVFLLPCPLFRIIPSVCGKIAIPAAFVITLGLARIGYSQTVVQADQFVDSVGVNIHLHYTNTLYGSNFPLIESALQDLGVRHVRDGIETDTWHTYDNELNTLGNQNIKAIFVSSPSETPAQIKAFEALVPHALEGIENPNEYDNAGVSAWASVLKTYAPELKSAATSNGETPYLIGPSLVKPTSYATLGSVAASINYGNVHDYPSWRNPGTPGSYGWGFGNYGSIPWALQMEGVSAPKLGVMATETGYTNATNTPNYVPESVSAVYMPRLLLQQYLDGIKRTYIYELLSSGGEDFGLLRSNGYKKPAFFAASNLLNLLSDPGASFTTTPFPITITGGNSNVHSILFEKRNHTYYLAVWVELPRYDGSKGVPGAAVTVSSVPLSLKLSQSVHSVTLYQWDEEGQAVPTTVTPSQTLKVTASDQLSILELVP